MNVPATLTLLATLALPFSASAQGMNMAAPAAASPADKAFADSMQTMMKDMKVPPTGNVDRDFALMMIPHHQGAIDMAQVELKYGKDPALLKMAGGIVKAQQKEIALMNAWLRQHPK